MRIALLAVTKKGWKTAELIQGGLPGSELYHYTAGVKQAVEQAWRDYDALVCVMAAGIVVRCIAGLCTTKFDDPCVIVADETGRHVISLLSGHIGGGNMLAKNVADIVGGSAVVTTASDVSGHTSVDVWSIEQNCTIADPGKLAEISAKILNRGILSVFQDRPFVKTLPDDFRPCIKRRDADIIISQMHDRHEPGLHLIPRTRYIGFGCRKGATVDEFKQVIADLQAEHALDLRSVAGIASIDLKKDEAGLLELRRQYNWPVRFFSKERINEIDVPGRSEKVFEKIGVHSVSEAAAILAASVGKNCGRLIIEKKKWQRITAAVAEVVS